MKHLASYKSRVCEVDAWTALYGRLRRSQITAEHVRKARATWTADDYAPKTINNRVQTLQHLYHMLDGEKAPTPADDVEQLPVPESVKVLVPAKVFRTVAANLTRSEDAGAVHDHRLDGRQAGRGEAHRAGRRRPRAARLDGQDGQGRRAAGHLAERRDAGGLEGVRRGRRVGAFDASDYAGRFDGWATADGRVN